MLNGRSAGAATARRALTESAPGARLGLIVLRAVREAIAADLGQRDSLTRRDETQLCPRPSRGALVSSATYRVAGGRRLLNASWPREALLSMSAHLPYTDALPYYDRDVDLKPGMRAAVEREIDAEKRRYKFDAEALLPPPPKLFEVCGRGSPGSADLQNNEHLAALLESAERGEKLNALDTTRYQLPSPDGGLDASSEDWQSALDNAATQLAHMDVRCVAASLRPR